MKCVSENVVFVGTDFTHGHDGLIHLVFYDFIIGQLFSQDSNLSLESTHLILVVRLGFIKLSLEHIEFLPQHIILVFMNVEIGKSLLVDAIDPLKLFRLDFELNSGLSKIAVKLPLEIPMVNHHLIVLPCFLLELSRD